MADQGNTADPKSQGAVDGGDKTKLYAGKYKTPEELEAGYKELERGFHESRQEISQLNDKFDTFVQTYGQSGDYGRGQSRQAEVGNSEATQVLTQFYNDPVGTLQSVKEQTKREILQQQQQERQLGGRVAKWSEANQDVTQYPELMEYWVQRTDARWAPEKRLDEAAKQVRSRLAELRGKKEASPGPGDYVEGPESQRGDAGGGNPPQQQQQPEGQESQLAKWAAERNAGRVKRLGSHGR